jgi:hypothetical protein
VAPDNQVTFSDSSYNEYGTVTYVWNYGDTTLSYTAAAGGSVHTYANAGVYTVTLIVTDSCGSDTAIVVVDVNSDGIITISGLSNVMIYPNPASNNCVVRVSATQGMDANVEVDNMLGEMVQSHPWQISAGDNKLSLGLAGMASGMYTVVIRSSLGVMTKKLDIIK